MPIVGLTHEKDGRVRLSRSITTKVAIGLPPDANSNFPKRLDHFIFLRKTERGNGRGKEIVWDKDAELTKHYGEECREFWIVFLDDDPDQVFRTEVGAYVKRGIWCRGNGESAQRRDLGRDGKGWGEFQKYEGPCANNKCPVFEKGECKPSGDLYFMLAENPTLGSICKLHTSSYQSIRQIYSALQDLRRITGGRLLGVSAKLFVHPDKNVYEDNRGATVTGTKYVLGLELRASDIAGMQTKLLETARVFNQIKGELGGQVLELEDPEEERGPEIAREFYPESQILPAEQPTDPEEKLEQQAYELLTQNGVSPGRANMTIAKYRGRLLELIAELKEQSCRTANGSPSPTGQPPSSSSPGRPNSVNSANSESQRSSATSPSRSATSATPGPATPQSATSARRQSAPTGTTAPLTRSSVENIHGLDVSDDDLPENMQPEQAPPAESAPASSPSRMPQQASAPTQKKGDSNAWTF